MFTCLIALIPQSLMHENKFPTSGAERLRTKGSKNKLNIQTSNDMRTRRMTKEQGKRCDISRFPNFHRSGSIKGMKRIYYGMDALLVRCGEYIYNVSSEPRIYYQASY